MKSWSSLALLVLSLLLSPSQSVEVAPSVAVAVEPSTVNPQTDVDVKNRLSSVTPVVDTEAQINTLKSALGIPDSKTSPSGLASACTFTGGGQPFDLTGAANLGDLPGSDSSYTYKLHVCDVVADAACVAKAPATFGGSVCQYNTATPPAYIHLLSSWVGTPAPTWALINAGDPTKGVQVSMANGDACYNMGTTQPRAVTINFPCTPNVPGGAYTISTQQTNPCAYIVSFPTQYSCPGAGPGPGPDPTPGGGGGSSKLSGGTIFLIVMVVVIPVYIAAGCIFKRQRQGTTGCESAPTSISGGLFLATLRMVVSSQSPNSRSAVAKVMGATSP